MRGFSLVEMLIAVLLITTLCAIAVPGVDRVVDHWRTRGAAFFMASRVALTRMQAVRRNANVGLRFVAAGGAFAMRAYADGNRNGLRSAEIASGVDPPLGLPDRLDELFPGVSFGFIPGASLIDGTAVSPGDDPIRLGTTNTVIYSPLGTSSSGTVYVRGRGRWQFAVVVLGATGRGRVLEFDPVARKWTAP
jgi:prepilin-type N-terminal cleavage/methylation domain-containing protein